MELLTSPHGALEKLPGDSPSLSVCIRVFITCITKLRKGFPKTVLPGLGSMKAMALCPFLNLLLIVIHQKSVEIRIL